MKSLFIRSRRALPFAAALMLAACVSTSPNVAGNWQSIGETHNGNIRVYIDSNSIRRNGNTVTFREHKVINKPALEQFTNLPAYKSSVSEWEIQCAAKRYRLLSMQLFNERQQPVLQHQYSGASSLKAVDIPANSLIAQQAQAVCGR